MKKVLPLLFLVVLAGCGDETIIESPTAPPVPEPPLVSGGWQGVVTSSTLPNAVWTMTLTQEDVAATGTWADDVNLLDGSVAISVTADGRVIGTMTLNVRPSAGATPTCTASSVVRGTVEIGAQSMDWTADGWPQCAGTPIQARMDWRRVR